jgi:hypothetical protein
VWNKSNWGRGKSLKLLGEGRAKAADSGEREPELLSSRLKFQVPSLY